MASPPAMAVGQDLQVVGQGFVDPQRGRSLLVISGRYFDPQGQAYPGAPINLKVEAHFVNSTQLTWRMLPNIVFHPDGNKLGRFVGEVRVLNQYADGNEALSAPVSVGIEIKPSLVVRALRPQGSDCRLVVSATTEDQPLSIAVEAVGLLPGTPTTPLTFSWTFLREHLSVGDTFGVFDTVSDNSGAFTIDDVVRQGAGSALQDASSCAGGIPPTSASPRMEDYVFNFLQEQCRANASGEKRFLFKALNDLAGTEAGIKTLRTRKIVSGDGLAENAVSNSRDGHVVTQIGIRATDAQGSSAQIVIPLEIFQTVVMRRDTSADRIVEFEAPEMVGSCIPGGVQQRQISYRENQGTSRQRGKDVNLSPQFGGQLGFVRGLNFSMGFGVSENSSVSTTADFGRDVSSDLFPGFYAQYYRQAVKIDRVARLTWHDKCGSAADMGEAILVDWDFTAEVATGPSGKDGSGCPPPSHLPPVGPCRNGCQARSALTAAQQP
ncbi:MAG: hypothetical protein IPL40_11685 [Proteobacteria bacterium]|nr:hypothetical protein [Pseudomonadota bacterium]